MSHADALPASDPGCCQACTSRRRFLMGVGALGLAVGLGTAGTPASAADEVHWSYEGADGPEMRKGGWNTLLDRLSKVASES